MRLTAQQTQAIKRHLRAGLRVLKRPEPLPLAEWADRNFYLSAESSYTQGPWKSDPYQVAILNAMGNDDIVEVNWRKSARVGYTKCITAAIAYFAEHKQRNQMLWQPTDSAAADFMQQHVQPTIRDVPVLRALSPWIGKKHSDNKLDYKRFSNSRQLFVRGGKSAGNYREKSVDVVYYDELSKFDPDIEGEGPPTLLGDKRLEGSSFPKSIRGSTPTLKGECQLSKAADEAEEQFQRWLPCPHCGEYQIIEWGGPDCDYGIKWDSRETVLQAYYVCKHHGCVIEQRELAGMDERGEYRSQTGMVTRDGLEFFRDGEKVPPPATVSFHVWAAYSTRTTWGQIARDFLRAKDDPVKLKGWVNTTLGEPWEEAGERVEAHHLYMRREHYPAQIPQRAVVVVGGVDVQDDRIECSAWAFGGEHGTESWLVEHQVFWGDPSRWDLWRRLTEWRQSVFNHESGARLRISATAIDTGGHYTDMVYKYCKQHAAERVFAIKGSSTPGAPLVGRPSKNNKGAVNLFSIGTDTAKEMILGRLQVSEPGAGYVHFPVEIDREYCEQMTAEKRVPVRRNGRTVYTFKQMRPRNEALDCYVYALAALEILNPDFKALAAKLAPREPEPDESESLYYPQPQESPKPRKRRRRNAARKIGGLR
ncbi:phage terminase large subunit family protein [Microbulbifer thermotolerans]|uniref:Phage terminase large subunit family protein n=1 Tax=Microbulbifer thermotolerans TaxID=252514 RepID=A0AB35HZN8_MICTH|nr:terminase gpA endonuclease subunit [Microbulbifer thermotolerans]MCX2802251.1 phage terminase large subunit family protein [Microbulbifer thermotolerans]